MLFQSRDCERRVIAAKDAVDRAEAMGWLFAKEVRDGIDALEKRLGDVLKENLRLRALVGAEVRRQMPILRRNFYELWPMRNHEGTTERRVVRRELRKLIGMMRDERAFYGDITRPIRRAPRWNVRRLNSDA